MIIGVTGPQGSGKTTVANHLGDYTRGKVIHGDELAHEVLTLSVYNEVLSWFGLEKENEINRKRLGKLLFANKELMDKYNAYIYELMKFEQIFQNDVDNTYIIDWNFLPITPLMQRCDIRILLECSKEIRRKRVMDRDNVNGDYFDLRDSNGLIYNKEEYDYVLTSDDIIQNDDILKKMLGGKLWN